METPPVLERKKPIRPVAVEYKQLSGPGVIQLEPFQVIQDCFNEGSTPKFNFAPNCKENNYVRSCKFSSTGTHLVTDSEDRRIRIFELDEEDKVCSLQTLFRLYSNFLSYFTNFRHISKSRFSMVI